MPNLLILLKLAIPFVSAIFRHVGRLLLRLLYAAKSANLLPGAPRASSPFQVGDSGAKSFSQCAEVAESFPVKL